VNCPPAGQPVSAACFEQGVARTQNAEWRLIGAVFHGTSEILLQLAWLLTWGCSFWVLVIVVLYANFGQRIDLRHWTVITDVNGRL
jgi:hypothetical protein